MKAHLVRRDDAATEPMAGRILARDVRGGDGERAFAKGSVLRDEDVATLRALPWDELHLIEIEPGELHESEAGARIARAAAGDGVDVGELAGGHWPLTASRRGIVEVDIGRMVRANTIEGVCVYSVYDGQIVERGELVTRAKITPFVLEASRVDEAVRVAREEAGLVRVRAFRPLVIGALVQETLGERAMARFRDALSEKVAWFGSTLLEPRFVPPDDAEIAAALERLVERGAQVVVAAGTKAMDPLDPTFRALQRLGVRLDRYGVPAHPGSLLWLAHIGDVPMLGMPSCGLFSQATTFDLVMPKLLAGQRVDAAALATLGHGGLLSRDVAFRFPQYRAATGRGAVE
jgi:hypothetical protein